MRCGNEGNCEYYKNYETSDNNFPIDEHDQIIEIVHVNPPIYQCRAIDNQDCSVTRNINLLEKISFDMGDSS